MEKELSTFVQHTRDHRA